jgi:hypothetical protein
MLMAFISADFRKSNHSAVSLHVALTDKVFIRQPCLSQHQPVHFLEGYFICERTTERR